MVNQETLWVQKTQDEDKPNKHNTMCVEHIHTQDEAKQTKRHKPIIPPIRLVIKGS